MENKIDERYNTKVEIPISVILETIFNTDNHDVETLSRWALKYGFVDLIEKDDKKYYKLQDDYKKQSFYIWLSKEERKQYDYEDYLIEQLEQKENIIKEVRETLNNKRSILTTQLLNGEYCDYEEMLYQVDEEIRNILDKVEENK